MRDAIVSSAVPRAVAAYPGARHRLPLLSTRLPPQQQDAVVLDQSAIGGSTAPASTLYALNMQISSFGAANAGTTALVGLAMADGAATAAVTPSDFVVTLQADECNDNGKSCVAATVAQRHLHMVQTGEDNGGVLLEIGGLDQFRGQVCDAVPIRSHARCSPS